MQRNQRVRELTGDAYKRESTDINQDLPVTIRHKKCQSTFQCSPIQFIHEGVRCKCEKPRLKEEVMKELLSVFVQNFEIIDIDKRGRYIIRFKDGEVRSIYRGKIYQDATCICPPEFFDRIKEPWGLHGEYEKYM